MLKHKQHWGYDIGYEGTTLRIRVRRPPVIADTLKPLAKLTIGIDAGHGIGNEGAKGATGAVEKDITLSIAKELKALLQSKGIKTVMTRESDWNVGNNERIDKMLNAGVHLFVSIHANSIGENADPEAVKGTSAYFRYPRFKPLSDIIYRNMLSLGLSEWGVTGNFNFSLSGATQYPNVLVETAFMSNPEDEMKLIDENFRKQIAQKIVDGLEEFVRTYAR
jgi:N-acetylmuramoyl-L-alanine amidase